MTPAQKEDIYKLRLQGLGYKTIARELLIGVDAIKGYCKRHHLRAKQRLIAGMAIALAVATFFLSLF